MKKLIVFILLSMVFSFSFSQENFTILELKYITNDQAEQLENEQIFSSKKEAIQYYYRANDVSKKTIYYVISEEITQPSIFTFRK